MTAEFTAPHHVITIRQVQEPTAPPGRNGSCCVDEHADGSRAYRRSVRLADFDQIKGLMVNGVKRLDCRIEQRE